MPWFTADKSYFTLLQNTQEIQLVKTLRLQKTALELTTFELFLEQVEELKCVK